MKSSWFPDMCKRLNAEAADRMPALLEDLLPEGRVEGLAYLALNPTREDRNLGSFRIEFDGPNAGRWRDWATGDHGSDFVSLVAYLKGIRQGRAAKVLQDLIAVHDRRWGTP